MTDIVARYAQGESYGDICKAFGAFPKISFDYEVVEREKSLVMVPFYGEWKDLGTWSTLCDVLPSTHIGNVKMGEHNENTHVVNELGIPVFCDGLRDIIIAASPDGILVCEKTASKNIKNAVRELSTRPMYEERRWGTYRVLDCVTYPDGLQSLTKSITLKAGKNISYQIHHHRAEVWTIVDGEGIFVLDGVQNAFRGAMCWSSKRNTSTPSKRFQTSPSSRCRRATRSSKRTSNALIGTGTRTSNNPLPA